MIAEERGKLVPDSSQDFERLEDLLTDYVFGTLKYVDRGKGLGALLGHALPEVRFTVQELDEASFSFWPSFEGTEPDVVITVGPWVVVVEAKLFSGFGAGVGSEDDQLVREFRKVNNWAQRRRLNPPAVLAVTAGFEQPPEIVEANRMVRSLGLEGSLFKPVRWVNWQTIAALLDGSFESFDARDQDMVEDLLKVMERRGVRYMFEGFAEEDYWLMAAAQRRASDSVYPTLATFCKDLLARLGEQGIRLGVTENKIVVHGSTSLDNPERWGNRYLYLPLWPTDWPARKNAIHTNLFVQFSLREPQVWVGYRQRIATPQRDIWSESVEDLVAALRSISDRWVAAAKYPDFHQPILQRKSEEIDSDWMKEVLQRLEVYWSIHRVLPLDALSHTAGVADIIFEDKQAVESMPLLLGAALQKASG